MTFPIFLSSGFVGLCPFPPPSRLRDVQPGLPHHLLSGRQHSRSRLGHHAPYDLLVTSSPPLSDRRYTVQQLVAGVVTEKEKRLQEALITMVQNLSCYLASLFFPPRLPNPTPPRVCMSRPTTPPGCSPSSASKPSRWPSSSPWPTQPASSPTLVCPSCSWNFCEPIHKANHRTQPKPSQPKPPDSQTPCSSSLFCSSLPSVRTCMALLSRCGSPQPKLQVRIEGFLDHFL